MHFQFSPQLTKHAIIEVPWTRNTIIKLEAVKEMAQTFSGTNFFSQTTDHL